MALLDQILASLLVNGIGICCLLLFRSAPHRLTLYLCLISMGAIFVPWPLLGDLLVSLAPAGSLDGVAVLNGMDAPDLVASLPAVNSLAAGSAFTTIVVLAFFLGSLFALWTIRQSKRTTSRWRKLAKPDSSLAGHTHPKLRHLLQKVTIQRLPNTSRVATTGLWRPEIWVGDRIQSPEQITTALNHELCHVASRDQLVLLAIVMLERLLWWNPLVWFLGRRARRSMEYACDTRCKMLVGPQQYGRSLAEILLLDAPAAIALETSLGNRSDIVHRMESLNMKTRLTSKHLAVLGCAGLTLAGVSAVAATNTEGLSKPTLIECHKLVPEGVHFEFRIMSSIDTREGRKGQVSVSLVDPEAEQTTELPNGSAEFLACVQGVVGVGDDEGWPGT